MSDAPVRADPTVDRWRLRAVLASREPLIVTRLLPPLVRDRLTGFLGRGVPAWVATAAIALLPLALDLLLWPLGAGSSWRARAWMAIGAILVLALLASAPWAWNRVKWLGDPIDRMLQPPDDLDYVRHVDRWLNPDPLWHYLLCAGGAAAGIVGAAAAAPNLPDGSFGPAYYLGMASLGFLGADAALWLVRFPLVVLRPLTKISPLRVVLHSPVSTPGIREMGQLAAQTALRAGLGFFLFGLPLLWAVLSARPGSPGGDGATHTEILALMSAFPLAASAAVVVYLAFVPQLWLSIVLTNERDRVLDELAQGLPEQGAANLLSDPVQKVMALYDKIAATSLETAEGRVIFKRGLLVVAALLPQLYALIGEGLVPLLG
jgi:hypothetical protein